MIFVTAFITGLLGSFHCAGMCGPIALATPTVGRTLAAKLGSKCIYNLGRIVTYCILGALLGAFGLGLKLAGLQQSISIAAGIIIILGVIASTNFLHSIAGNPFSMLKQKVAANLFHSKSFSALFLIGLLNGLLPCGFVYIGLIGSVATQSVLEGALFMALFGLGTFPMMFGISVLGQFLSVSVRSSINRFTPAFAIIIGCLFILRGLNLGIPYISPKISDNHTHVEDCCKVK